MLPPEYEKMMLVYLSNLAGNRVFQSPEELALLDSRELLRLAEKVDDDALGLFVQMLKGVSEGSDLFQKLMGDHEEENRRLVDAFFRRYMASVVADSNESSHANPLVLYLPSVTFADLAFVQSRQAFFCRQSADTINDYLSQVFPGCPEFLPGEQEEAWNWFWGKVTEK